jgi:hypothetical protein
MVLRPTTNDAHNRQPRCQQQQQQEEEEERNIQREMEEQYSTLHLGEGEGLLPAA